ncbi:MAG: hypothetical protein IT379_00425, partial [Deltaproteobacteria bacterium]|nr:hypothetical protein [Deltaproteobacteria bacterium]
SWFACATVPLATPLDSCDEDTFVGVGLNGPPTGSLTVPTQTSSGEPPEGLVVFGIACDGGEDLEIPAGGVGIDSISDIRCEGARDQQIFTTTVPVQCPAPPDGTEVVGCERNEPNTRPPPLEITLDGEAWTPDAPLDIDTREVHRAKYVVEVGVPDETAYESYTFRPYASTATETRTEELLVTFGSDGGRLEGPYRVLSFDHQRDDMEYTAPRAETVPADREIRFFFVTRDDRGGMRMETRVARVRP